MKRTSGGIAVRSFFIMIEEVRKVEKSFGVFIRYVSASVCGMIGISCYVLVDTFFIAKGMGSRGLASLNLGLVMYSLMYAVGQLIGIGGGTRYAVAKAEGNQQKMDMAFTQSVYMALLASAVFVFIGLFFCEPITGLLGADEETFDMTYTYVKTIYLFSPAFMLNQLMIAFVRNDGNPSLSMADMLLGSGQNIVLDYVFIFIMKWGMFGAALSTGLAPITGLLILSFHITLKKNQFHFLRCPVYLKRMIDIGSLGMATFVNEISAATVMLFFNLTVLKLEGNTGVAAYGVVANLAWVATAVFNGIAQGIQPVVSDAYGRKNVQGMRQMHRYAVVLSLLVSALMYAVIYLFADPVVNLFNNEQNQKLQELAVAGVKLYFIGYFFGGINIITASYFGAMEKAKKSFSLSILRGIVVVVPVLFILSYFSKMTGVWLTFPCTELIVLAVGIFFLSHTILVEEEFLQEQTSDQIVPADLVNTHGFSDRTE